jgi:hypothetical protein
VPENRITHFWALGDSITVLFVLWNFGYHRIAQIWAILWKPKFLKWVMCHGKHFHRIACFWAILWKRAIESPVSGGQFYENEPARSWQFACQNRQVSKRDHRIAHFWVILWAKLWQVIESPIFGQSLHKRVDIIIFADFDQVVRKSPPE